MKQSKLCHHLHCTQLNRSWQTNITSNFSPTPTITNSKCKIFGKRHPTFPQKCFNLGIKTENMLWTLQQWYFKVKRFLWWFQGYPMNICVTTKRVSPHSQTIYKKLILISTSSLACSDNLIAQSYKSQEGEKPSNTFQNIQRFAAYAVLLP